MPSHEEEDKPCRACSDFKTWAKQQKPKKGVAIPTTERVRLCTTVSYLKPTFFLLKSTLKRSEMLFTHF